jgi:DNA-binding NarL/FixJ family response regulator
MTPIRVLIVDDHQLLRQGLCQLCEVESDLAVVGEARNGREAVDLARRLKPDVVLMDIRMPVMEGIQATHLITEDNPATRVIVLTSYRQDSYVYDAIKAGARGYLPKNTDWQDLLGAIRAVHRGEAVIPPELATGVLDEFRRMSQSHSAGAEGLSPGEMDVLRLLAQGADNRTIARELALAEKTVANRLSNIYNKLHVSNRTQAALYALRQGWASLDPEE